MDSASTDRGLRDDCGRSLEQDASSTAARATTKKMMRIIDRRRTASFPAA